MIRDILRFAWRKVDNFLTAGINPDPIVLCQFRGKADLDKWRVFTDASFGGTSSAKLELSAEGKSAVFSGQYSKDVGEAGLLIRSGYCGINHVRPRNVNLALHDYLDFRIKGDGNTYVASLRADQLTGGDEEAWQAPLPTRQNGEWENVRLELNDFIFTFRGRLVKQSQSVGTIPKESIMSVGIILAASDDMSSTGGFRFELESVTAGAHYVTGMKAQRKIYHGDDIQIRYDPMWDSKPSSQSASGGASSISPSPSDTLGGRKLRAATTVVASMKPVSAPVTSSARDDA